MKIFILGVDMKARPRTQPFTYPRHNHNYGVEQNFYEFINKRKDILVSSPEEADYHYLPIYWTRWHLNNNYGSDGLNELSTITQRAIIDEAKTFTICQYDDGPLVDLGGAIQFLSSRKSNVGIDIPLLSKPHRKPFFKVSKKFRASFIGRVSTNSIRADLFNTLKDKADIFLHDGDLGSRRFVSTLCESYLALSPRGYGGSSFRFYEAMQLGVVPVLIGDIDTRPFKNFLPWDDVSFYCSDVSEVENLLKSKKNDVLLDMGKKASEFYESYLKYDVWCPYVLSELERVNR